MLYFDYFNFTSKHFIFWDELSYSLLTAGLVISKKMSFHSSKKIYGEFMRKTRYLARQVVSHKREMRSSFNTLRTGI